MDDLTYHKVVNVNMEISVIVDYNRVVIYLDVDAVVIDVVPVRLMVDIIDFHCLHWVSINYEPMRSKGMEKVVEIINLVEVIKDICIKIIILRSVYSCVIFTDISMAQGMIRNYSDCIVIGLVKLIISAIIISVDY